jgi:hypothetical protein
VYSLSRGSDFVGAGDGVGGVGVSTTSTCTWTVWSNNSWLTVAAGTRTGNGTVEYHHTANPGAQRSGTLTVAGITFQVTQPGTQ